VAVLVEVLTDNKNRTVAEVRHVFSKYNGSLGEVGCVGWMFDRKGYIVVDQDKIGEDELIEKALDAGAEDVRSTGDIYEIYTEFTELENVRSALESAGIEMASAEPTMIPQNTIKLDGKQAEQMLKLYEAIEDLDDVSNVYANFDIDESVMEEFSEA